MKKHKVLKNKNGDVVMNYKEKTIRTKLLDVLFGKKAKVMVVTPLNEVNTVILRNTDDSI